MVPSLPDSGEVLIPMVMARLGSSTVIAGRGIGLSASANVSPIVTSARPAMETISPGPADSAGTCSRDSVTYISVIFAFSMVPSTLHQAMVPPFFSSPLYTRQMASRPT